MSLAAGALLGWWVRPESLFITIPASLLLLLVFPRLISRFNVPLARTIEAQENKYSQIVEASVHGVIEAQIYGYLEQSLIPAKAAEIEIGTYSNWTDVTHILGEDRFKKIRNIARFESVRNDIIDNQYGNALYSIFILEKDFPNSMYLKRMKAQTWMNLMLYLLHDLIQVA